jgi:hypothetical protein
MKLLDRYMHEVRNHLPRKMQADLEIEIRSLIEDTLEDRSQAAGREIDEDLVAEVLQEFGPPEKVTAAYLPEKYLIGPKFYPSFILTVRIVLIVITALTLIGTGISIGQAGGTPQEVWRALLSGVGGFYSAALQSFGLVVVVFAIIQWAQMNVNEKPKAWDPRQLKEVTEPNIVRPSKPISEIVFAVIALVVLNFYPHLIGLYSNVDGSWALVPVLSQEFFGYIPWINLILAIKLVENLVLLRQGQWQPVTRGLAITGSLFNIILLYTMLTGPALLSFGPETAAIFGWSQEAGNSLESLNNGMLRIGLGIVLVLEGIDLARSVYQLFKSKPAAYPMRS